VADLVMVSLPVDWLMEHAVVHLNLTNAPASAEEDCSEFSQIFTGVDNCH